METLPIGFDTPPDDSYRKGHNGKWYTYSDLNKANKHFFHKKFETPVLDKVYSTSTSSNNNKEKRTTTAVPMRRQSIRHVKIISEQLFNNDKTSVSDITIATANDAAAIVTDGELSCSMESQGPNKTAHRNKSRAKQRDWTDYYVTLVDLYRKGNVSQAVKQDHNLRAWATKQRSYYSKNELGSGNKSLLDEIGFVWRKYERQWTEPYNSEKFVGRQVKKLFPDLKEYIGEVISYDEATGFFKVYYGDDNDEEEFELLEVILHAEEHASSCCYTYGEANKKEDLKKRRIEEENLKRLEEVYHPLKK